MMVLHVAYIEAPLMPEYRAYELGSDEHLLGTPPTVIVADSDSEAIELLPHGSHELWCGARLVYTPTAPPMNDMPEDRS